MLANAVVEGPIDLAGVDVVRGLFRCRNCTFRGRLVGSDATFARTVDLSGSSFRLPVTFSGATFQRPALFRALAAAEQGRGAEDRPARLLAGGDFSLAVFDDFVSFKGAELTGGAAFRDTRFADATFAGAVFASAAFDGASFRGAARFSGALFTRTAGFGETDFKERADFSVAQFQGGAVFTGARFVGNASFLAAQFAAPAAAEEAGRFDSVAAAGNVDFTFARFANDQPARRSSVIAVFSDLVCAGSLVLRDAEFAENDRIAMDRLQVRNLVMDTAAVLRIEEGQGNERRRVLELIEESAKERDDLGVANDAHYRLRVLESESYGPVLHALDYVFYRGVAGYFVRPFRPLLVLLALVLVFSAARTLSRARPGSPTSGSRLRRVWSGGRRWVSAFVTSVLNTFALVGPRRGDEEPPLSERLEAFTYRLLAVCALLGLANSNPTLRQMVDTLF